MGDLQELLSRVLCSLLREIAPRNSGAGDEVIADLDVDGVHYTLIRLASTDAAPPPSPGAPHAEVAERYGLSSREREVARMVAKGYTNKTIAAVLDISSWTVDTHIRRIFGKLGVRSRSAMVAQLAATGVVGAQDDATPDWQTAWREHAEMRDDSPAPRQASRG
jgi:DNA-binding CsgD family transcriptional regulator